REARKVRDAWEHDAYPGDCDRGRIPIQRQAFAGCAIPPRRRSVDRGEADRCKEDAKEPGFAGRSGSPRRRHAVCPQEYDVQGRSFYPEPEPGIVPAIDAPLIARNALLLLTEWTR